MAEHRKFTSAWGLAKAEQYKLKPPSLNELLNKYAQGKYKLNFGELTLKQKNTVYYEIIQSSARDNPTFTTANKKLKIWGKVGILITASLATYQILNAENKPKETIKQGMGIAGSLAGGAIAGMGVSAICGPGAPICAVAIVLIGSAAGGYVGSSVADSFDDEIEEFTKWDIF